MNRDLEPQVIAEQYKDAGASCISVLTDSEFFGGSVEDLQSARKAVELPVLRKDFTVSLNDICDAKLMNADCILLIVAALEKAELADRIDEAKVFEISRVGIGVHQIIY